MSILTLDVGGTNLSVQCQKGGHAAPRTVGNRSTAFAGVETSAIRAEVQVVPVILTNLTPTVAATIRALFALGAQVSCAGDVFNNGGATVVCSGKITDELHSTAAWWELSLTLYDTGAGITVTPVTSAFILTGVVVSGVTYVMTPNATYPGDSTQSFLALSGASLSPGGSATSSTPERAWLSVPLAAGFMYGSPQVRFDTSMTGTYSGTTVFASMGTKARLYQVRSGVDIAGPWDTNYGGVSLGGSTDTVTVTTTLSVLLQAGDRLRLEFWSRLALQTGVSDNGQRQSITFGAIAGPSTQAKMIVSGLVTT